MAAISIQLMIHNNTHAGITLKHWMNDKMVEIMWDKELKTDSHHLAIHSFLIPWRWCYWSESRPPCTCVRRCSLSATPVGSWSVCACSGWRSQRGWSPPHRSWWRGRAGGRRALRDGGGLVRRVGLIGVAAVDHPALRDVDAGSAAHRSPRLAA